MMFIFYKDKIKTYFVLLSTIIMLLMMTNVMILVKMKDVKQACNRDYTNITKYNQK